MKFRRYFFWYNARSCAVMVAGWLLMLTNLALLFAVIYRFYKYVPDGSFESASDMLIFNIGLLFMAILCAHFGVKLAKWGRRGVGMLPMAFWRGMEDWMEENEFDKDDYRDYVSQYATVLIESDAIIELDFKGKVKFAEPTEAAERRPSMKVDMSRLKDLYGNKED